MNAASMLRSVTLLCLVLNVCAAHAETAFISDELTVPMRSGPTNGHRIIRAGLPSGTQLEVLSVNETAGFSEVRTARGTEGWVRTQYLVSQPIAKQRLVAAQREISQLRSQLADARARSKELSDTSASQASANSANQAQIAQLQTELEEIKRISADAIEAHNENLTLNETNTRLRDELDDLAEERDRLESNAENQAIMIGAGLIFIGLLAGVIIKSRPQRSAWS